MTEREIGWMCLGDHESEVKGVLRKSFEIKEHLSERK